METGSQPTAAPPGLSCPACGLGVMPGYIKCPKCHAALPQARAKRSSVAGGTAVEAGESRGAPWLLGLALVVVGGGILAYVLTRDDAKPSPEPGPEDDVASEAAGTGEASTPDVEAGSAAPGPAAGNPVRELEAMLRVDRLWSSVAANQGELTITGNSCGEATLVAHVESIAGDLKRAGLTRVVCRERHGAVVFERDL